MVFGCSIPHGVQIAISRRACGCGSKIGSQNRTLVNGNMDPKTGGPISGGLILTKPQCLTQIPRLFLQSKVWPQEFDAEGFFLAAFRKPDVARGLAAKRQEAIG